MPQYPPIQVVDEEDRPLRGAGLQEIHEQGLLHRVVHIFVEDDNGRLLLQRRGPDVATHPNMWDYSAGGHVDEGETYLKAAQRELAEELGLPGVPLEEIEKFRRDSTFEWRAINRFVTAYKAVVPEGTAVTVQESEVTEAQWFSLAEIARMLRAHPEQFTPGLVEDLGRYYEDFRNQTAG